MAGKGYAQPTQYPHDPVRSRHDCLSLSAPPVSVPNSRGPPTGFEVPDSFSLHQSTSFLCRSISIPASSECISVYLNLRCSLVVPCPPTATLIINQTQPPELRYRRHHIYLSRLRNHSLSIFHLCHPVSTTPSKSSFTYSRSISCPHSFDGSTRPTFGLEFPRHHGGCRDG